MLTLELRDLVLRERKRFQALRLVCSALREDFRLVLRELDVSEPLHSKTLALRARFSEWPRRFDDLTIEKLEMHRNHVEAALRDAHDFLNQQRKTSAQPEVQFRRTIQDSTEDNPESCSTTEKIEAPVTHSNSSPNPLRDDHEQAAMTAFTAAKLYGVASEEMRLWIDCFKRDRPYPDMTDILQAAVRRVPELGINESAWVDALEAMTPGRAALALLVIDANRSHPVTPVRNPGGLLREFVRLHRRKKLNLCGSLHGLIERSTDNPTDYITATTKSPLATVASDGRDQNHATI